MQWAICKPGCLYHHLIWISLFISLLVRKFKAAVNCSNFAQTSYCKFEKDVATIIQDSYESLCNTGSGKKAISGAASVSTGLSLTIFVVAVQLLRGSH